MPINALKRNARNARTHSSKQVRQIADSITAFGFLVPILIDEGNLIIAGHGRYAAAKLLGLKEVPVIGVHGLSEGKRRALAIADNKIAENAGWDREVLAIELPELAEVLVVEGLDISITGFAPVEIDQLTADFEEDSSDPADAVDPEWAKTAPVTKPGDLWELGNHRILCGDARGAEDLARLMEGTQAAWPFWIRPTTFAFATSSAGAGSSTPSSRWHPVSSRARISWCSSTARWRQPQPCPAAAPFISCAWISATSASCSRPATPSTARR
jgi:hypothetical protein